MTTGQPNTEDLKNRSETAAQIEEADSEPLEVSEVSQLLHMLESYKKYVPLEHQTMDRNYDHMISRLTAIKDLQRAKINKAREKWQNRGESDEEYSTRMAKKQENEDKAREIAEGIKQKLN